ncbi:MAG: lactonase family protein [Prevotellaceae bacterium]|jgi:6-phosphogluconolactonase|nr:lactonase family protein [Prevotellaceae bacterium]
MKHLSPISRCRSAVLFLAGILAGCTAAPDTGYKMIVGAYTEQAAGEGVCVYEMNVKTGDARQLSVGKAVNPSYVALSPDKRFVYAVNESGDRSAVSAFSFDPHAGTLQERQTVPTPDVDPCYLAVTDRHVVTAGYGSGSIAVFERRADGSLGSARQVIRHTGSSGDTAHRQTPHVHQTIFTPDGRHLLSCDLGTDRITVYRYNAFDTASILTVTGSLELKKGSGPRHLAFNAAGDRAYVLQELDGTLTVLSVHPDASLSVLQETTVANGDGGNGAAAIHLSPDGRFVYATNRGTADNITCFSVATDGRLERAAQVATGGRGPRDFAITRDGRYLLVANQRSDLITVFKRNKKTGTLTPAGMEIKTGAPVCIVTF